MPVNFQLALVREVDGAVALERLKELAGGSIDDSGELWLMPELWVRARPLAGTRSQEVYRDNWGLDMRTLVGFGLGYKDDDAGFRAARQLMSLGAARLADALDTDAGLSYELDRRMLHRSDGVLRLYSWWPEWAQLLDRVPQPYELTDDPGEL